MNVAYEGSYPRTSRVSEHTHKFDRNENRKIRSFCSFLVLCEIALGRMNAKIVDFKRFLI